MRAVVAVTVAGTAAVIGSAARAEGDGTAAVRLGVPAYWSATAGDGTLHFGRLATAAGSGSPSIVDKVVVNGPASGPADPFDPALATQIRRLRDRGVTVLGYVDTGYLGRTGATTTRVNPGSTAVADWRAQATADALTWYDLYGRYGLRGVFLDQTPPTCGPGREYVHAYGAVRAAVRGRQRAAVVAINPGAAVEECYTAVADSIVLAENTFAAYRDWNPPQWVRDHPARMFWHLVHGAATVEQMREAVALARRRHAGTVYVTDAVIDPVGGPWNALPGDAYWSAELAAVRAGLPEGCLR